jgi:hypothetical protein
MLQPAKAEVVVPDGRLPATRLAPHLSIMEDSSARLEIEDVLAMDPGAFLPNVQRTPSFGFTRSVIWLKFDVRSVDDRTHQLAAIVQSARLDRLTWYIVDGSRVVETREAGALVYSEPYYRLPRIEFDLPAGELRTIYVRSESRTSQWLDLKMGCVSEVNRSVILEAMFDVSLIGFTSAVVLFGIVFTFLQRQQYYLFLSAFAATYLFYYLIFNGYVRLIFPSVPLWVERELFGMICGMCIVVFTRFNRVFLEMRNSVPRILIAQRVAETAGILSILSFVVLDFSTAIRIFGIFQAVAYLVGSFSIVWQVRTFKMKGKTPLLFTWFSWGLFVILLNLQFTNFLPVLMPYGLLQQLFVPVILSGFFIAVAYYQLTIEAVMLELAQSQRAETSARLAALRYQINPHFLFNALTSIDALSRSEPSKIPELIRQLATFLRLRLLDSKNGLASLRQEIESLRAYLDIEHLRFGETLNARFQLAPESLDWMVPELVLQPLVENALKYGFDEDCNTDILIDSAVINGRLRIRVTNPGKLDAETNPESGFGIGIENIRSRLRLHFGDHARFHIVQEQDQVIATILISPDPKP